MTTILLNIITLLLTSNVQVYRCNDLQIETLTSRTPDTVIVEEVEGTVLDEYGNGLDKDGYYISYRYVDCEPGEQITTYCIYNPQTQFEDDILYRIDITEDGNVYIN